MRYFKNFTRKYAYEFGLFSASNKRKRMKEKANAII